MSQSDTHAVNYNIVTRPREIALAALIAEPSISTGARTEARFELAALAAPLIAGVARKYREYSALDLEDLQQAGLEAAFHKTETYRAALGKFSSWATDGIRNAIADYARRNAFAVVVEDDAFKGRAGSEAATARSRQWSVAGSLEALIATGDGTYTLADTLAGDDVMVTVEDVEDRDEAAYQAATLHKAIAQLTGNQQVFITLHLAGESNDAIGKVLGIGKAGVSMLKKRAFAELAGKLFGIRVN